MRRVLCSAALAAAASTVSALPLSAQGALSTQGFGYPLGQLSTRALGTLGAIGEIDARSSVNPASITLGLGQVFAQYDPEVRNVSGPSGTSRTTTSRFPNFGINLPIRQKFYLGFSASTLLDRTWSTQSIRDIQIGGEDVTSVETLKSDGGITDLRLSLAYVITPGFRVGIAGHQYTGQNRINLFQEFPDSSAFGNINQTTTLNYEGNAISAGFVLDVIPSITLAGSARRGYSLELSANDTALTKAKVPNHYGASISYDGIPGTIVAVRYARDEWSAMNGLSTIGATAIDADEFNAGVESAVLRTADRSLILRAGARWRKLPFLANSQEVKETSFGGGLGIPLSRDRAALDLALFRSSRSGVAGISETAYTFSFGLRIQP